MALRKRHRDSEVATDSLNDIMFFLLLFFLILSTMVSPNAIKVALPDSTNRETIENREKPIHVAVTKDRRYYVNSTEVPLDALEGEIASTGVFVRFASLTIAWYGETGERINKIGKRGWQLAFLLPIIDDLPLDTL